MAHDARAHRLSADWLGWLFDLRHERDEGYIVGGQTDSADHKDRSPATGNPRIGYSTSTRVVAEWISNHSWAGAGIFLSPCRSVAEVANKQINQLQGNIDVSFRIKGSLGESLPDLRSFKQTHDHELQAPARFISPAFEKPRVFPMKSVCLSIFHGRIL